METIELKFKDHRFKIHLRDEVDQSVCREIFKFREYRSVEDIVASLVDPILDVGAHVGFFTLYARALNPRVKIYALEPEEKNFLFLGKHLEENNIVNVKTKKEALGLASDEGRLLLAEDHHNHRLIFGREPVSAETITVRVVSLADFCQREKIKKIGLVKMDIEGGENEILPSWRKEWPMIKYLILEYHEKNGGERKALENILRTNGFGVQVFPSRFDKRLGFLLARNKRTK